MGPYKITYKMLFPMEDSILDGEEEPPEKLPPRPAPRGRLVGGCRTAAERAALLQIYDICFHFGKKFDLDPSFTLNDLHSALGFTSSEVPLVTSVFVAVAKVVAVDLEQQMIAEQTKSNELSSQRHPKAQRAGGGFAKAAPAPPTAPSTATPSGVASASSPSPSSPGKASPPAHPLLGTLAPTADLITVTSYPTTVRLLFEKHPTLLAIASDSVRDALRALRGRAAFFALPFEHKIALLSALCECLKAGRSFNSWIEANHEMRMKIRKRLENKMKRERERRRQEREHEKSANCKRSNALRKKLPSWLPRPLRKRPS